MGKIKTTSETRINHANTLGVISYLLLLFGVLQSSLLYSQTDQNTLTIYNWEEYMPASVLTGFEKKTGYNVKQIYYKTDDLKSELLAETGGRGMDLIIGSGYSFNVYVQRGGLLANLDGKSIQNALNNVDPIWGQRFPRLAGIAIPYAWGTMGIAYRSDLIKEKIDSWNQLMAPEEYLRGKIMMINDYRDAMASAFKVLGHSINESDPQVILQAGEVLSRQRPFVKAYGYIDLTDQSELINGSIWMAQAYNGDVLQIKEHLNTIEYVVPKEGSNVWVDCIAVLEASKNKPAAMAFINYINEPEVAALIALELNYASPNMAAMKFLPPEHLNNPLIYPSTDILQKSELYQPLDGRTIRRYNNTFLNVVNQ